MRRRCWQQQQGGLACGEGRCRARMLFGRARPLLHLRTRAQDVVQQAMAQAQHAEDVAVSGIKSACAQHARPQPARQLSPRAQQQAEPPPCPHTLRRHTRLRRSQPGCSKHRHGLHVATGPARCAPGACAVGAHGVHAALHTRAHPSHALSRAGTRRLLWRQTFGRLSNPESVLRNSAERVQKINAHVTDHAAQLSKLHVRGHSALPLHCAA